MRIGGTSTAHNGGREETNSHIFLRGGTLSRSLSMQTARKGNFSETLGETLNTRAFALAGAVTGARRSKEGKTPKKKANHPGNGRWPCWNVKFCEKSRGLGNDVADSSGLGRGGLGMPNWESKV